MGQLHSLSQQQHDGSSTKRWSRGATPRRNSTSRGGHATTGSQEAKATKANPTNSATEPGAEIGDSAAGLDDKSLDLLRRLKSLHDEGVLTETEFAAKKAQILRIKPGGGSVPQAGRAPVPVSQPAQPTKGLKSPAASPAPTSRLHADFSEGVGAGAGAAPLAPGPNPYKGQDEKKDKATRQMFDKRYLRKDHARTYIPAIAEWRSSDAATACATFKLDESREGTCEWLRVFVRKRPLLEKDVASGDYDVVTVPLPHEEGGCAQAITVHNCLTEADLKTLFVRHVTFAGHGVFGESATSEEVFEHMARPLVTRAVEGCVSTIFSFGQTGSGKTFTCNAIEDMAAAQIFEEVEALEKEGSPLDVHVTFVEIAGRNVSDLLGKGKRQVDLREDLQTGCTDLKGASKVRIRSAAKLLEAIEHGKLKRATETTAQNAVSSRSHACILITVEEPDEEDDKAVESDSQGHGDSRAVAGRKAVESDSQGHGDSRAVAARKAVESASQGRRDSRAVAARNSRKYKRPSRSARPWLDMFKKEEDGPAKRVGKLYLVDLAGTERKEDSMWHTAERRKEGAEINSSLYALKECLRCLAAEHDDAREKRTHVHGAVLRNKLPYKMSALTRVLAESFLHEKAIAAVLATVSPGNTDTEHTLHTLNTVTSMCGLDSLTNDRTTYHDEVMPEEEVMLMQEAPTVNLPARWSHDRVKKWMKTCRRGSFAAEAERLPPSVDGGLLVKEPVNWFKTVLCDGDEKKANRLYAALRAEVEAANKARYDHVLQMGKLRERAKFAVGGAA